MKTLTAHLVSVAMLLALPVLVSAQVLEGDLTLRTQAEVDAFNYTEVTGSLTIGMREFGDVPPTDIISLKSLSILTKVGPLFIWNNPLQTLQGLEHLTTIGGELDIRNNAALTSLQGLENLTTINENLIIEGNAALTSLQGLENLTTIDWGLHIEGNDALTSLQGLENLSSLEGLSINDNNQLQDLQGLENLTYIRSLQIEANPELASLQGLENLTTIEDSLLIEGNMPFPLCRS